MPARLRHALPALVGLVLFAAALEVLRTELHTVSWHELSAAVWRTPSWQMGLALLLTAANYAVLTGYDFLAFAYLGRRPAPRTHIAVAAFVAYAIANNVGFAMLSGASVRYRFYTRWGLAGEELSRIVFSYSVTFWLGLLALGGLSLAVSPLPTAHALPAHALIAPVGWLLLLVSLAWPIVALVRRAPLQLGTGRLGRITLPLPRPRIAAAQLGLSLLDWTLAGAVLYVLLPPGAPSFLSVLGAFLAAQLLGLASHVPGGVGVFEGLMVLLLGPFIAASDLLPALLVYRAVYYLLPLCVALLTLMWDELRQRRAQTTRVGALLGWLTEQAAPRLLAAFTFFAGVVLLLSGATPSAPGRLDLLGHLVPLGVIEVSHFVGSLAGAALLLLSHGLARRLDAAYVLAALGMAIGMAASLLKGGDYEEALLLAFVLLVLWRARPAFDRRAALFDARASLGWIAAVAGALLASLWLGVFAFKHVEYSHELWWQFELGNEASRFLRASVGAVIVVLLVALRRLLVSAPHDVVMPTDAELEAVGPAIAAQTSTFPYLVYLRDKALLFDEDRRGFVTYGVQGRTWVALGDPVGPPDRIGPLVRQFLERCDDFGGVPVFYEIRKEHLHRYADFGLTFVKLGEEAVVDLHGFTLDGGAGSRYRQAMRRLEKDGAAFRIVPAAGVPAIMDDLRAVSDDWLREKTAAEKGFSLGSFRPDYIARFPVAVIERCGDERQGTDGHDTAPAAARREGGRRQIVAFANIWPGPRQQELSVDLMRYHRDAPKSVMDGLFAHILAWGQAEGYGSFTLGMVPLSGFEASPVAPLWNRMGAFLYQHGELFYNFQGLRAYKSKFNPTWEPHYLAYPGGLRLPRIMADVAALIAGGYQKVLLK